MKKMKLFSLALMTILAMGMMSACGSDGEGGGGGNGASKGAVIDGKTYPMTFGEWELEYGRLLLMEFANTDLININPSTMPNPVNVVTFSVEVGNNATGLETGTFPAHVEFYSLEPIEGIYYSGIGGEVEVTIAKNGDNYSVTVPETTVISFVNGKEVEKEVSFSFGYNGPMVYRDFSE